ncbi:hypothetical protein SAMN05519104_1849 [Rhizobiales bacterium GAS188]|nr:hypothetical protein SAMN05519104_1849 [Rhizobiales bacterium GAS188]
MAHEEYERGDDHEGPSNRSFGWVFTAFLAIVAAARLWKHESYIGWLVAACALMVVTLAVPHLLTPFNRLWMKFGELLSKVMNPVIMGILFFVVVTPFAFIVRAIGKKLLPTQFDRTIPSYWVERVPPGPSPDSMKQQF